MQAAGAGLVTFYLARVMLQRTPIAREQGLWNLFFTHDSGLGNLEYAVRGGRVPRSRRLLANLLRATPVLKTEADGRITAGGALFGRRHRLEKFARYVLRRVDRRARLRIAIGHAMPRSSWFCSIAAATTRDTPMP